VDGSTVRVSRPRVPAGLRNSILGRNFRERANGVGVRDYHRGVKVAIWGRILATPTRSEPWAEDTLCPRLLASKADWRRRAAVRMPRDWFLTGMRGWPSIGQNSPRGGESVRNHRAQSDVH